MRGWILFAGVAVMAALWGACGGSTERECEKTATCPCESASDCAGREVGECEVAACTSGKCGVEAAPDGTACSMGECRSGSCVPVGAGGSGTGGSGAAGGGGGSGGQGGCEADLQNDPSNCGACGHDCLGGGCSGGQCEAITLASGFTGGGDIDVEQGTVYWVQGGSDIMRAPADGSGSPELVIASAIVTSLDVAPDGSAVYFSRRANLSDAALSKKVLPNGAFSTLHQAAGTVNLDRNFYGIAAPANQVFFCDVFDASVQVVPTTGGGASDFATGQAGANRSAVGGDKLYWVTAGGIVRSKPILGGNIATEADLGTAAPHSVDATAAVIAWSSGGSGSAYAKTGANVVTLGTGLDGPRDVAVDGMRVFISVENEGLFVASATTSGVTRLAPNVSAAVWLAQDAEAVYWTTPDAVYKVAKPPL